jgi:hypothetical protein
MTDPRASNRDVVSVDSGVAGAAPEARAPSRHGLRGPFFGGGDRPALAQTMRVARRRSGLGAQEA